MAPSRRTTSLRHRRHADRPRPWTQFPWTLLGMAFVTSLFLASYQAAGPVPDGSPDNQVERVDPSAR